RSEALGGQLNQELPLPSLFEAASEPITPDAIAEMMPCGPDPERHVQAIRQYLDAGFDELYISQIGSDQAAYLEFFNREIAPRL
ncbi:MAG: luciferase-like protein, partial [Acidimicrobiaceae bacterium]|nr:luciferase-like protein [Acidimicrobiaceae bacterium]